jgi:WD40 repeat protein
MVKTVAFSPDGAMVASGGGGDIASTGELFVWELSSREPPRTPTNKGSEAVHHRPIEGIAFSPDGKTLASASRDGMLVFWDLPSLEPIRTLEGHQFASIAFNRGGQILASGGRSGVGTRSIVKEPYGLILWDLARASPRAISSAEVIDDVRSVTFDGGNVLASGGPDGRVILWDIGGDKVTMRPLPGHKDTVTSMSFSSDSQTLVSGSADGTVILRDLRGGALSVVLGYEPNREAAAANPFYAIQRLALSSDGKMLAFQGSRGKIVLWDVVTGIARRELSQPGAAPISVAFTPDARTLAAASAESLVSWDVSSGAYRVAWIKHAGEIDGRSFSADGKVIALKMPDHSVLLWDMANGAAVGAPLSGHREALTDLAFSPDGKTLASGSEDGAVMLWNIASRQPLEPPFPARAGRVENLTFSRNGNMLAFAVSDGKQSRLALWNGVRRESADLSFAQPTTLLRLAFSPDAKVLAAATRAGDVLLWNVMSRQPLGSLTGHQKPVANFMFSSAGDTLISVDESGTALLWDMLRRSPVGRVFLGHAQGVRNVVIGNDANVVVSSSLWGNELIVTDWDPASWAKHACQAANRELTRNEWDQFVGIEVKQEPICPRPASLHAARTISQDRGVDPIY